MTLVAILVVVVLALVAVAILAIGVNNGFPSLDKGARPFMLAACIFILASFARHAMSSKQIGR